MPAKKCNLRCWMLNHQVVPFDYWVWRIFLRQPFAYVKYNDGEWAAILGTKWAANCDGHAITAALGEDLARTLRQPIDDDRYFYASGPQSPPKTDEDVQKAVDWLREHGGPKRYVWSGVFLHALQHLPFWPMLHALRSARTLIVGPPHLAALKDRALPNATFVEIPPVNCFDRRDDIMERVLLAVRTDNIEVVTFSASMATEGMIYDMWPKLSPHPSMIDVGCLWDIFCGVKSRGLFGSSSTIDWPQIINKSIILAEHAEDVAANDDRRYKEQANDA